MVARRGISRVRWALETAWATDGTGTMGNFYDVRHDSVEYQRANPEMIDNVILRSKRVISALAEPGKKTGTLTISGDLVSSGVTQDASTSATKTLQAKMLEQIAGGYVAGAGATTTGSAVASSPLTTGCVVTAGHGARFQEGLIVWVETASGSGLYNPAVIDTVSTDTLTFSVALAAAPAVGSKVLNSLNIYETDQPSGTVQWLVEGEDRDNIFLYMGCQGSLGFTFEPGKPVKFTTQQMTTQYVHDDELATPQGGSAMSIWSPDGSSPVIWTQGSCVFAPAGATTRVAPSVAAFTFDPGIAWQEVTSVNGVETRGGFERVTGQGVATLLIPHSDETYKDAIAAQTAYRVLLACGNTATKKIALHLPNVQILSAVPTDRNGLDYDLVTVRCHADAGLTDQSTDLLRAPWRLAF